MEALVQAFAEAAVLLVYLVIKLVAFIIRYLFRVDSN